ncbi:hypothetical protein IX39_17120 [Chryseobacterium formosense]|uniref:Uncharacterized protein n=1 Tax=Chryseobacterium formosense TaxID=236814 RepID=A0A085Z103_9FLAO|nr:hypothetical protein [Chryseobacterium formosense]KFE98116.1 hypothetical protein IX39_17120 [Chryseobacterium formosense]SFT73228.1 hypothetical protein SAMN05421857_2829 [Chryseobacterium formosense]
MKKIFLVFGVFVSTFFFAQKSENFYEISYNSICCGPPSTAPVMNYVETFQSKNKRKAIEIFRQSGLGREGEFKLFIGIDALSKSQRSKFLKGLETAVNSQNNAKNQNSDGIVNFSSQPVKKENLKQINNLTIYKKEKVK